MPKPERFLNNDIHLVSFDFCGQFKHTSLSGNKYGLIFVAHHGHVLFRYPIKSKDEFPKFLQQFLVDYLYLLKTFPHMLVLGTMKSDNAKELDAAEVRANLAIFGIRNEFLALHQQYQNGTSEKAVGDVMMTVQSIVLFCKAPKRLLDWAFKFVCHVKRLLPTSANPGFQSPLQIITGMKHSLTEIIPFGSLLFAVISKKQTNDSKLDARAVRCIFIGY